MDAAGRIKRIAVKIGSNLLADSMALLDMNRMNELVRQVSEIKKAGIEVILISSGAVASGRGIFQPRNKIDTVRQRQLWSSLGQVRLMQSYSNLFEKYQILCSQVLVTKEDFRSRVHYLNMKNCFQVLLMNNIIPIVNENDVVAVTELMFTDNDELAGLVATMLNVDCLYLLTTVDGILKNEKQTDQSLIKNINHGSKGYEKYVVSGESSFGKGGMLTKAHMAVKVAAAGIEVKIANGTRKNILVDLLADKAPCTRFEPSSGKSSIKKWLSHAKGFEKGAVHINDGALQALTSGNAVSLLPIGIVKIDGKFEKGDLITIYDEGKKQIGLGIAQYNDELARMKSGKQKEKPLIHYDYLFLI